MSTQYTTDEETSIDETAGEVVADGKVRIPAASPAPNHGWVKMQRSPDILELIETAPLAFALAAVIALRARWSPGVSLKGLQQGEAWLGDYRACGMSLQQYRTAKKQLERWRYATFKPTSRGTTAKLIGTRLFDVLNLTANKPGNKRPTSS